MRSCPNGLNGTMLHVGSSAIADVLIWQSPSVLLQCIWCMIPIIASLGACLQMQDGVSCKQAPNNRSCIAHGC